MPNRDGFAVLSALAPLVAGERLPVPVVTGDNSADARHRALLCGAKDFVTKPLDMVEVSLRVRNLLETRVLFRDFRKHNRTLLKSSQGQTLELETTRVEMFERLAMAAECRDDSTNHHNARVGALSARLAEAIGMASLLRPPDRPCGSPPRHRQDRHPGRVLRKPGKLTPAEFAVMQTHTTLGPSTCRTSRTAAAHPDHRATTTSGGTAPATRTGWPRTTSRTWPASWRWPTPSTP